jgi:membrane-bound lytic murein transglycosylase B
MRSLLSACALLVLSLSAVAQSPDELRAAFIDEMVERYGFDRDAVTRTLYQARHQPSILETIARPAERRLNWTAYRKIFLNDRRIDGGVAYWREHEATLRQAEERYGVPPQIIVAIIGVETLYGRITGGHRVLDALHTLGFHYPRRGPFFREQLSHFLRFAREEGIDPTQPTGSYAGAMGVPQFMPDSFRIYAVDFDGDGRRDIWDDPADVIGSVANYFVEKGGWRRGEPVAAPAEGVTSAHAAFIEAGARPTLPATQLRDAGIRSSLLDDPEATVSLIEFDTDTGPEYWVARDNFHAIMRYNPRTKYAMAVYQLSEAIRERRAAGAP